VAGKTLYDKVWDAHVVGVRDDGQTMLYIDQQLLHEVTSPQAFEGLTLAGRAPWRIDANLATPDHNVPTVNREAGIDGITDLIAREQVETLDANCKRFGITQFDILDQRQGIVHVVGPEQGATLPGMTVVCGDSHTSTHGAFGAIAFGIGTSQVRDVLASQSLAMGKLKVRRIWVDGQLQQGVYAKDLVLHVIRSLGVKGGVGYAYEFAGPAIDALSMEERMTLCNMAIEGGARCGYVNPDQITYDDLKGRPFAPAGAAWDRAVAWWSSLASGAEAVFDDEVRFDAAAIAPTITWGITPGQGIGVDETVPTLEQTEPDERPLAEEAYRYMDLQPGAPIAGTPVDVCFIGSCTNGRIEDMRTAAQILKGRKVHPGVRCIIIPGSQQVYLDALVEGLIDIFIRAGAVVSTPTCGPCLGGHMGVLADGERCVSTTNRNFVGRMGSAKSEVYLSNPAVAAASAVAGRITSPDDIS